MIGRRISQPKGISAAESRKQLAMFLANARDLDRVDVALLERRYNVAAAEIGRALDEARRRRGGLV